MKYSSIYQEGKFYRFYHEIFDYAVNYKTTSNDTKFECGIYNNNLYFIQILSHISWHNQIWHGSINKILPS